MRTVYYKSPWEGLGFAETMALLEHYKIHAHEQIVFTCCGSHGLVGDHHVCPAEATRGHDWITIPARYALRALIYCGVCGFHAHNPEARTACRGKTEHIWVDGRCALCLISNGGAVRPCRGEPPRISPRAHRCNGGRP